MGKFMDITTIKLTGRDGVNIRVEPFIGNIIRSGVTTYTEMIRITQYNHSTNVIELTKNNAELIIRLLESWYHMPNNTEGFIKSPKNFTKGSIVRLKECMLGNNAGEIGVAYDEYNLSEGPGISVIFPNGKYDGFSPEEQKKFLELVDFDAKVSIYNFHNVMELSQHFKTGFFYHIFKNPGRFKQDDNT